MSTLDASNSTFTVRLFSTYFLKNHGREMLAKSLIGSVLSLAGFGKCLETVITAPYIPTWADGIQPWSLSVLAGIELATGFLFLLQKPRKLEWIMACLLACGFTLMQILSLWQGWNCSCFGIFGLGRLPVLGALLVLWTGLALSWPTVLKTVFQEGVPWQGRWKDLLWVGCSSVFFATAFTTSTGRDWLGLSTLDVAVCDHTGQPVRVLALEEVPTPSMTTRTIQIRNYSSDSIRFLGADTTCTCISGFSWPMTIPPHETATVPFTITTRESSGEMTVGLTLIGERHYLIRLPVEIQFRMVPKDQLP